MTLKAWMFFGAVACAAAEPILWDEAPTQVKRAVQISTFVDGVNLTSALSGENSGSVDVTVSMETQGRFHLYEDQMGFATEAPFERVEVIEAPTARPFLDPVSKSLKPAFRDQVTWKLRVFLTNAQLAEPKVPVLVSFQACSDEICLLPFTARTIAQIGQARQVTEKSFLEKLHALGPANVGIWLTLFAAGFLTAFTPCVYPLYPITLGVFSKWGSSAGTAFGLSLLYSLGLSTSYALVGLIGVASGAAFGAVTQSWIFYLVMGLVLLFSTAVFAGWIELKILGKLANRLGQAKQETPKSRGFAALSLGMSLGLVAAPCVGPVLIALLAWINSFPEKTYLWGFILLGIYGLGMSVPFLILGHFSFRLGRSPRLGAFTPMVKSLGTALMLGSAVYFFYLSYDRKFPGSSVQLPFRARPLADFPTGKPTIIDFKASWCVACKELEEKTFASSLIASKITSGDWDFVQVDLTETSDENAAIIKRFSILGLPTVLIADSSGKICSSHSLFGFEKAEAFAQRLSRAQENCQ